MASFSLGLGRFNSEILRKVKKNTSVDLKMHGVFVSSRIGAPIRDHALLDDSDDNSDEDDCVDAQEPSVKINVGGNVFETKEKTLRKIPGSRLSRLTPRSKYYRQATGEYFFDRDPEIFRSILNYHRIGELHLPLHLCGPLLERELQYWRIPEQIIEKCCWIHYIQLRSQKYSLVDFEGYFADPTVPKATTRWRAIANVLWLTLNKPSYSKHALIYAFTVALFVFLSIFAFVAETHSAFHVTPANSTRNLSIPITGAASRDSSTSGAGEDSHHNVQVWKGLEYIDYICLVFFTIDMFLRFISAPDKMHFFGNVITVIEIIAIIPYYVDFSAHMIDLNSNVSLKNFIDVVHVLRIFGVLRILKILRYYSGLQVLVYTLRSSYKDLLLMLTFIGVATLFFSSLIYYVDDRQKFTSIPTGFWWSIVTMTTVGYGDFYPTKTGGYIIGSACALIGVLVVAFTVPILVNSFMLYYSHAQSILTYKEEGTLKINSDNERAYLDYTFNTLKRLSFHTLMPKIPDLRAKTLPQTDQEKEDDDSNVMIGGSTPSIALHVPEDNHETVELEEHKEQILLPPFSCDKKCFLAPPDPFSDPRKPRGENGKLAHSQNHVV